MRERSKAAVTAETRGVIQEGPQNPARVAVLMDVADTDVVMAAMSTEPMAEAMAHDGVLPETLVILVEA